MIKILSRLLVGFALFESSALADEKITSAGISEVIAATDAASVRQDTQTIGYYLGEDFYKYIDVRVGDIPATVRIDKEQYLEMIDKGWEMLDQYSYNRLDTVVHVAADGQKAESFSTIVETVVTSDGQEMISKVREYASYKLEGDRPVIVRIESHTLVGDTTPN